MFVRGRESAFVEVAGHSAELVERLRQPLRDALETRRRSYGVVIETIGRVGEVLVSVTSSRGRAPFIFGPDDLEPAYVARVVSDTVARFGL
jgi:hypothetical protein